MSLSISFDRDIIFCCYIQIISNQILILVIVEKIQYSNGCLMNSQQYSITYNRVW